MIFVTGATGFVGKHVVRQLDHDRMPGKLLVRPSATELETGSNLETVCGEIQDPDTYRHALGGVDTVIHLASQNIQLDGHGFEAVNVNGTRTLARACSDAGVRRVIYLSSAGVYGHRRLVDASESTPLCPDTALSRSKAKAETVLAEEFKAAFTTTILRPRFIYGAGDKHFEPGIVRAIRNYPIIPVSGRAHTSLIHVKDLARICIKFAQKPITTNDAININDGATHTVRSIFQGLAQKAQLTCPRFVPIPMSCLYYPLVLRERISRQDPEVAQHGLTSLRIRFLGLDSSFSNVHLCQELPALQFRSFQDYVSA